MFFKGKLLVDEQQVAEYSKIIFKIEFTNDDVVLYMVGEAPKNDEQVSILTQSVDIQV